MSNLKDIKERILSEDRVGELLELMGCEDVSLERGDLYVARLPEGKNKRSVQVRLNESLTSHVRSRGLRGDIFTLVSYIVNGISPDEVQNDLYKAQQWIIEVLNYHDIIDGRYAHKKKKKVNAWLKDIKKSRTLTQLDHVKPNVVINEKVKNKYIMMPYKDWIDEGISWETQMEYEVGFDLWSDRIVTMVRNSNGELIGVKGRYVGDNEDILHHKKYLYLHKMNKSIELFNIHKALPYILKHKCVIVFEGYKSVMKAHTMGIYNTVSIEGDDINPVQASLLKELGIDVKIILAFDKDKMTPEIDSETGEILSSISSDIMKEAKVLTNREVFALIDENHLLDDKDSPVDKGVEVFSKLYKNKVELPVPNIFKK